MDMEFKEKLREFRLDYEHDMFLRWLVDPLGPGSRVRRNPFSKTKTPPEQVRGGVHATAWLSVAADSVSHYASANPSRSAGFLLRFLDSAVLVFPYCPSAQSSDFNQPLTDYSSNLPR